MEELNLNIDGMDSLGRKHGDYPFPAASFHRDGKLVYFSKKCNPYIGEAKKMVVHKNTKYIIYTEAEPSDAYAYTVTVNPYGSHCMAANSGFQSGFYPPQLKGKAFKVRPVKGGGLAICLEEEVR